MAELAGNEVDEEISPGSSPVPGAERLCGSGLAGGRTDFKWKIMVLITIELNFSFLFFN